MTCPAKETRAVWPREITSQLEDYLEAIAELQASDLVARAKDIAKRLGVTRGTVTAALKSLADKGLINYQPYRHVTLTSLGQSLAGEVIHRHRTLARYLEEVLRLPKQQAEENACRAEHVLDQEVIDRMVKLLAFMSSCPRSGPQWLQAFERYCQAGQDRRQCEDCIGQCLAGLGEDKVQ